MKSTEVWKLSRKRGHEVEHLGLHGGVEGGRRLVQYEKRGLRSEGHGDHDPLQHPARELVGVGVAAPVPGRRSAPCGAVPRRGRGPPPSVSRRPRTPRPPGARPGSTGSALARAPGRPSRRSGPEFAQGLLLMEAGSLPFTGHRAGAEAPVAREIARDGKGSRGLSAARLADEAERLRAPDPERDVAKRQAVVAAHAIGHIEVAHLQRRRGLLDGGGQVRGGGERSLDEHRFDGVTDEVDGNDERGDGESGKQRLPPVARAPGTGSCWQYRAPQSGVGSCTPNPRNDSVAIVKIAYPRRTVDSTMIGPQHVGQDLDEHDVESALVPEPGRGEIVELAAPAAPRHARCSR